MPSRIIRGTLVALLVVCAGAFVTRHEFYVEALVDPFFGLALASILILHLRVRPRWTDAFLVGLSTLVFAFLDFRLLHYPPKLTAWFSFIGVSSLLVLAAACVCAKESDRKLLLYAWVPAFLFITSEWFASDMLEWTAAAHPKTLDLYLLSFDASLHVQLSFVMGRVFAYSQLLRASALFFYVGLAIPITLVYAGRLARFGTKAFSAMLAFLVTGPLGIVFYNIFPACGPAHVANRYFPFHPLSISQMSRLVLEPVSITGARNAIPSLHMAWTLLAWWYSQGLSRWERSVALAFLLFTILATLGTGEHYFIDLIVAFPFALMIEAICSYELSWKDSARLQGFAFGLGGTLLWLVALRFANRLFWTSPIVPWVLVIATVALAQIRHKALWRAVGREPSEVGPRVLLSPSEAR
jgi:PAP2 superfamily